MEKSATDATGLLTAGEILVDDVGKTVVVVVTEAVVVRLSADPALFCSPGVADVLDFERIERSRVATGALRWVTPGTWSAEPVDPATGLKSSLVFPEVVLRLLLCVGIAGRLTPATVVVEVLAGAGRWASELLLAVLAGAGGAGEVDAGVGGGMTGPSAVVIFAAGLATAGRAAGATLGIAV